MSEQNEHVIASLELVAAKVRKLVLDYKDGRRWKGDLQRACNESITELREVSDRLTPRDYYD